MNSSKTEKKTKKYVYLAVLQGCYDGRTWDDLVCADSNDPEEMRGFREDRKSYRENEPQYPHRVIRRRESNLEYGKEAA